MTVWRMVHGPPSFVCVAPLCPDQPCALCDMIPEFQGIVPDHTARHCGFLQVANKVDGESRFPAPAPRPYTSELLVRTWVNCQVIAARGGIRNMHDAQEVRLLADILQTVNGGPEGYQVAHLHRLVSEWLVNVDETDEEEVEWGAWDRDWASTTFIDALVKQCDREERALSDFTDARNAPVVRTWFLDFWNHIAATLSDPDAVLKLKTKCLVVRTQLLDLMRYDEDYEGCLEDLEELGEPDVFEMREHKGRNFGDLHMSMFLGMLSDWVVALGALGR